jgi:hypothetical protein
MREIDNPLKLRWPLVFPAGLVRSVRISITWSSNRELQTAASESTAVVRLVNCYCRSDISWVCLRGLLCACQSCVAIASTMEPMSTRRLPAQCPPATRPCVSNHVVVPVPVPQPGTASDGRPLRRYEGIGALPKSACCQKRKPAEISRLCRK